MRTAAWIAAAVLLWACGDGPEKTDVSLAPPAAGEGFQVTLGPFAVPSGEERQICSFFEVPSDQKIAVNRFLVVQNDGTHHMNIFRVKTRLALWGAPGEQVVNGPCFDSANWADWPLVHNLQESLSGEPTEWKLPTGVAHTFQPRELLMLQSHYVNAGAQRTPYRGRVLVNFYTTDMSQVTAEVGTLFATNQNLRVCPGETDKLFTATCLFAQVPVTLIGANGHFHSRGIRFTMSAFDPLSGPGAQFYQSKQWDDALFARDMDVKIPAGGGISYTCEYTARPDQCGDVADQCCYTFGPHSPTQEHCNAFVYYYPKFQDTDVNCF